jgi:hypothetical protein
MNLGDIDKPQIAGISALFAASHPGYADKESALEEFLAGTPAMQGFIGD